MKLLLPRTIAAIQIVGALWAALSLLGSDGIGPDADARGFAAVLEAVFQLLFYALFGLAFHAGVRLWSGSPAGVRLSRLVQALQIPILSTSVFAYNFYTGLQIGAVLEWPVWRMVFELGGNFSVTINYAGGDPERRFAIGVNLLAVVLLRLLDKWRATNMRGNAHGNGRGSVRAAPPTGVDATRQHE